MSFDVPSAVSGHARYAPDAGPGQAQSRSEGMIAFAIATVTILFVSVVGVLMALA
jgi:hypothetical protein